MTFSRKLQKYSATHGFRCSKPTLEGEQELGLEIPGLPAAVEVRHDGAGYSASDVSMRRGQSQAQLRRLTTS